MDARLRAILAHVCGNVLADIGCDHGQVSVYAVKNSLVARSIATDISAPSLSKAVKLAEKEGVSDISFRCGNGLSVIAPYEADVVVIAGMGAHEIADILSARPPLDAKYILVAHKDVAFLRRWLADNSFRREYDRVVKEGRHYYSVIVCREGSGQLCDKSMYLGDDDGSNPDYLPYLQYTAAVTESLLRKVKDETRRAECLRISELVQGELDRL